MFFLCPVSFYNIISIPFLYVFLKLLRLVFFIAIFVFKSPAAYFTDKMVDLDSVGYSLYFVYMFYSKPSSTFIELREFAITC